MNREQFLAIIWLRWRLTRNIFARGGVVNAVLSFLVLGLVLTGGLTAGVGGFLAGAFALPKLQPIILLLVWDGVVVVFLIFWLSGLMVEIQRSESIDLPKLLHLPVTLQQVFIFNYLASHATPSLALFLPGMLGLCAGLAVGAGPRMALLAPAVLGFIFMVTAWTYCLRGWLAALMMNKRRRRNVILCLTVGFILISQLPNLLINSRALFRKSSPQDQSPSSSEKGERSRSRAGLPDAFLDAHLVVPPGWIGYGAMSLRNGNPWLALGAAGASCLIGALGLIRAYRMTLRFYQGAEARGSASKAAARRDAPGAPRGALLVERTLPWLPDDIAGLALATFRSLLRAPEIKMGLIMPVIMIVAMGSAIVTQHGDHASLKFHAPLQYLAGFAAAAVSLVAAFTFAPVMSNAFGLDRNGFCALVLLPTRRDHILFAKNLAFFPFVATVALVLLSLAAWLSHMSTQAFLAGLLQILAAFVLFSLLSNVLAVLFPYRLAPGTLKAKKPKAIVFLGVFVSMISLPLLMTPLLLPPAVQLLFSWQDWLPWLPVNFLLSTLILAGVICLYWVLLPLEGRLLQRREQTILREVTEEVE